MEEITVQLFGIPEIRLGDEKIRFPYKKAEEFFYYLCVRKKVSRDQVICLLWGDEDETSGKKKLRDAVYQVKRLLGKDLLLTGGHTEIELNPQAPLRTDWEKQEEPENDGEFLDHFYIKNCYEFEEWAEEIRTRIRKCRAEEARRRMEKAAVEKDDASLQKYSNLLLAEDPYNEELYFETMSLYAENGSYTMAIRLYNDLKRRLSRDLSEEPSKGLKELFQRIYNMKETVQAGEAGLTLSFVGRKRELYQLSGFLSGREGAESVLAVCGESGSGKTAFLEQGIRLASGDGFTVLKTACYKQGEEFYLSPWNDIFQELYQLSERENQAGGAGEILEQFLNGTKAEEGRASRMTYPMVEKMALDLFQALSKRRRILLVFDDIQWMDSMSGQLLNRVLLRLGRERLLLLCSMSREGEGRTLESLEPLLLKDQVAILRLEPFTREETDELIRKTLPELASEEEKKAEIYRATDGNAFFLRELLTLIREKGYTLEKSKKTNYVIQARLSGLSRQERETLGAMAVFPGKIQVEDLELLLPDTDRLSLLRLLESLQERFLIREVLTGWNVQYEFVHRAFQEYVCEQQSRGKTQLYHQILARHYEEKALQSRETTLFPQVIYHYEGCHDLIRACWYKIEWMKEYYTLINENFPVLHWQVSDLSEGVGVMPQADEMIRLAGEIMDLQGSSEEIWRMKLEMNYILGRYHIAQGEYRQGLFHIEEGIRLAKELSDTRMLLSCFRQQIFYGIQVEDLERVKTYVEMGIEKVKENSPLREAFLSLEWELEHSSGQTLEETLRARLKESREDGALQDDAVKDWEEYGTFLRLKGWYLLHSQTDSQAERTLWAAADIFKGLGSGCEPGRAACLSYIGDSMDRQGRFLEAVSFYEQAIALVEKNPRINGLGQFYARAGQALFMAGNTEKGREYLEQAEKRLKENGCVWGLERTEALLCLISLSETNLEEAERRFYEGMELSEKIRNPQTQKLLETARQELRKSGAQLQKRFGVDGFS